MKPPLSLFQILSMLALLAAMVLIPALAGTGAYVAMIFALPVTLLVLYKWRWLGDQDSSFVLMFGVGYATFATFVLIPDRPAGSAIYIFDFIPFLLGIGLYVGLSRIKRERLLQLMSFGCLAGAGLSLTVAIYQVVGLGMPRANGFGGSAIYYANITLLLGFIALAPLFSKMGWHWTLALAPFFAIAAAVMSGSRSVVTVGIALLLVLVAHVFIWNRKKAIFARWWLWGLLSLGIPMALVGSIFIIDSHQTARIAAMFGQIQSLLRGEAVADMSLAYRFDFYLSGIRAFLERPWAGYGWLQSFDAASPFMQIYDPTRDPPGQLRHLHNDAIDFAVSFGIAGLVAYLLILFAPIATWIRAEGRHVGSGSYTIFAIVAAYGAMGLTDTNFVYEAPKVLYCFTAAGAAALVARRLNPPNP